MPKTLNPKPYTLENRMFMEWVLGSVVMSVSVVVAVAVWVWVYVSCWQSWLGAKFLF